MLRSVHLEIMLTTLLRPFIGSSIEGTNPHASLPFNPRERILAHVSGLTTTIWTYRSLAPIAYEYYLVHVLSTAAFLALSSTDGNENISNSPVQIDTLIRACQCLLEMRERLPVAADVLIAIHAAFTRDNIAIPEHLERYFDVKKPHVFAEITHHHQTIAALLPEQDLVRNEKTAAYVHGQQLPDGPDDMLLD